MNKLLSTLFTFSMLLGAHAQNNESANFTKNGVEYIITGENTVGVYGVDTKLVEVIIPETVENTGKTFTVTTVEEEAFKYSDATKIELPNTVTEIKDQGLSTCGNLIDLKLSENLRKLGTFTFAYCRKLTSISLPEGLEAIPSSCFASCESLSTINLPSTVKTIGNGAFYKTSLREFVFPASCESIGDNVFQLCPKLEKVTFNPAIKTFGEGTFRECVLLTDVNLEAAVNATALSKFLFLGCKRLADVIIPENVKEIKTSAFAGTGISAFKLSDKNKNLAIIDEAIYSSDKKILYAFPPKSGTETVTVIDGCIGIGGGAFDGSGVKKVVLPEGMRAFDEFAFCESKLADINFPSSLVYMGEQALAGTQFTSITLPENLTFISYALIAMSPNLTSVTIPASVRSIDECAFRGCIALREVHCLGAEPPYMTIYEEGDNPFGYIDRDDVTVFVPEGRIDAYKKAGWDTFSNFVDTEAAVFSPETIDPVNDSRLSKIESIKITFPEDAIIVETNPEIKVSRDQELYGTPVTVYDTWMLVSNGSTDKKTVNLFLADSDGFTSYLAFEKETHYFVEIPAGIVKNAGGAFNQKIVLHYVGTDKGLGVEDVLGTDDCFIVADGSNIDVVLGSLANCTVQLYNTNGVLIESIQNASNKVTFKAPGKGMFMVRVNAGGNIKTFKVLI